MLFCFKHVISKMLLLNHFHGGFLFFIFTTTIAEQRYSSVPTEEIAKVCVGSGI